jgi:hypothetical protein
MYSGTMLLAFCALIFVSQTMNLRINNAKLCQASLVKQSLKGPNGSLNNEDQNNPIDNEEEEDDDYKLEATLLKSRTQEFFIIKYYPVQENLSSDAHRKILSPPPQI